MVKISLKNIEEQDLEKKGMEFWIYDNKGEYYVHVEEGIGDNLLYEDKEEGYVDYIYYTQFDNLSDIDCDSESDSGFILLKQYYQDMTMRDLVQKLNDFEAISNDITILNDIE